MTRELKHLIGIVTYLFILNYLPKIAFAGGLDNTSSSIPSDTSVISPAPQSTGSISFPTTTTIQPLNTSSIGNVNPNCSGLCLYGNVQFGSSSNGLGISGSQIQGTLGFMWQPTSSERSIIEINHRMAESQISRIEEEQRFLLTQKLAEAISLNNIPMARGMAILLAPKLDKTPEQLLQEMTQPYIWSQQEHAFIEKKF